MSEYDAYLIELENYRKEGKEYLFEKERFKLHELLRMDYNRGLLNSEAYLNYCNKLTELRCKDFHPEMYTKEEVYNILIRIFNLEKENTSIYYHGLYIELKDEYNYNELKKLVSDIFNEVFKRDFTPRIYELLKKTLKL